MTSCEEFEQAIEQRLHGALSPEAQRLLEAHLTQCPSCASYSARSSALEHSLHGTGQQAPQAIDWNKTSARIQALRQRDKVRWALGLCFLVALLLRSLHSPSTDQSLFSMCAALGGFTLLSIRAAEERRDAARANREHSNVLEVYRRLLERRLSRLREVRSLFLAVGVGLLPWTYRLFQDAVTREQGIGILVMTATTFSVAAVLHLVRIPRLRRELADVQ